MTGQHGERYDPQPVTRSSERVSELNKLNRTYGVSFSRLHCCGHHGHGLWPSWFVAITVHDPNAGVYTKKKITTND